MYRNNEQDDRELRDSHQLSWCPWTWAPIFWGVTLVILGVAWIIVEVFEIKEFWEIAGGLLIAAVGISLLRAPFRLR